MPEMYDLLLEDILIMLIKGPKNRVMNIYQTDASIESKKTYKKFLEDNPELKEFYMSIPFIEFITKTILSAKFPFVDISVADITNEMLPNVKINRPPESIPWTKPPRQHNRLKYIETPAHKALYQLIRRYGSKGPLGEKIWTNNIYGMQNKGTWQFDKYKDIFFDLCQNEREACQSINVFIKSDYKTMDCT